MFHIVFDLDWTLVDTQDIHQNTEAHFFESKWIHIDPKEIWRIYGWRSTVEWMPEFFSKHNVDISMDEIIHFINSKNDALVKWIKAWKIQLMPWVLETLNTLHSKAKIWVSTWGCRSFIDAFLDYFNLMDIIEVSTSADEVLRKKPAPDVFIRSFDKLEKKHGKAVDKYVVWDAESDILWWKGAWAKTVLYLNKYEAPYDYFIELIEELNLIIK